MSAVTAALLSGRGRQAKLEKARGRTMLAWTVAAIDRAIAALKIEPAVHEADEDAAARPMWYGSLY